MKKFLLGLAILWGMSIGCGEKKPSAEELDQKLAVKIDSLADDLGKAADQLADETDQLDKDLDELLKDLK